MAQKKKSPALKKKVAPAPKKAVKKALPHKNEKAPESKKLKGKKAVEPIQELDVVIPCKKLPAKELKHFKQLLENLRDRVVDEIAFLAGDNLNRSPRESSGDLSSYSFHMADQGTDNFDREFALNLVSSEQDILYKIDDALRRIQMGSYGSCEACGKSIENARLTALPFADMCIACKSQAEKGKTRFRPFGPTISQTTESSST